MLFWLMIRHKKDYDDGLSLKKVLKQYFLF